MRRQFARCFGVASDRRQDQANGTLMTRPSARCAMISRRITFSSRALKPWLRANSTGSSQNLHVLFSRSTCTCGGSLQSKLVKKTRYGPGMPLTLGIQISWLLFTLTQAIVPDKGRLVLARDNSPNGGGG